jgi:hypothetical protein
VVSWIAEPIHKTINYEGIIRPLTPLIITPLFSDTNPKQAAALITDRGDRPAWGLVTNAMRLNPAKAFQAKVWVPQKRNQILRNAFLTAPMARIQVATAKDMAMKKEAIEAKWIQMSGNRLPWSGTRQGCPLSTNLCNGS